LDCKTMEFHIVWFSGILKYLKSKFESFSHSIFSDLGK